MKKKPVWMMCLAVALFASAFLINRIDAREFHGLRVMSEAQLGELTADLNRVSSPQNADELIELDGHALPYDRSGNTFYVSQPMDGKEYAGTFSAVGDNCTVYFQADEALEDKQAAIAEGHAFSLWFVTESDYAVSELIFTGLPLVCIWSGNGGLTDEYERGDIIVQDPDDSDVITMSIKESSMKVKRNDNSGTISFRLYKKNYDEIRDLTLLNLGNRSSWKLYPVYDKDGALSREMVASYVWNCVCGDSSLQKGMEYAEVILDGEYAGLYYLAPKVGKGFLELGESDRAYEYEGISEDGTEQSDVIGDEDTRDNRRALDRFMGLWEEGNRDFSAIDVDNYIDYAIYLQAACAVQNSTEEYFVIAYEDGGEYTFRKMPGRSKFVFGLYPSAIGWQSVTAAENVIEDNGYAVMAAQDEEIAERTARRWQELRRNVLSTDSLLQTAYLCEQRLADSGYIGREDEPGAFILYCEELHNMIRARMEYLDGYYGSIVE